MSDIVTTIKFDKTLKDDAQALADELGMSFSTLVKVLLKQAVRKKYVELDTREEQFPPERMTPEMMRLIADFERRRTGGILETSPAFEVGDTKAMKEWLDTDD